MGARHDGFYDSLATDITRALNGAGDHGLAHKVSTLSSPTDDLHS